MDEIRRACPWHEAGGEADRLTYFEFATLVGLLHFARAGLRAVVLEVGLGGRFDATNAVVPRVAAVARIGLDHTQLLGDTVEQIAFEKAGIFKAGVPAVAHAHQPPGALETLRAEALRRGAPFTVAPADWPGPIALAGPHQRGNAALAAAALRELAARGRAGRGGGDRPRHRHGALAGAARGARAACCSTAPTTPTAPPRSRPRCGRSTPAARSSSSSASSRTRTTLGMLGALAGAVRRLHAVAPATPRARPAEEVRAAAAALGIDAEAHGGLAERPGLRAARRLRRCARVRRGLALPRGRGAGAARRRERG